MHIVSRFKDYYDYIGQRYGEDPSVTYIRKEIPLHLAEKEIDKLSGFFHSWYLPQNVMLVVAGELTFPVESTSVYDKEFGVWSPPTYRLLDGQSYNQHFEYRSRYRYSLLRRNRWADFQDAIDGYTPTFFSFMKATEAPVFLLTDAGVQEQVPVMKNFGIASVCSPEDMWQNIYYTFTNIIRRNPDKEPPVEIANDDRIQKAGFDLKTSFRHPVNKPAKKRR